MKRANYIFTVALLFWASIAMGQRIREMSGDAGVIRGISRLNIVYDYSGMDVGKKTEKEYVAEKRESYNRKEEGRGDKWVTEWENDRKSRFEPRLEEEFNRNCDILIGNFPNEKYTMIFKTVYTEPGFNVGVARRNAYIDAEVWIVETADKTKVLAKLSCDNCPGRTAFGTDFDNGLRIQEAYAMAGKGLGRYFRR